MLIKQSWIKMFGNAMQLLFCHGSLYELNSTWSQLFFAFLSCALENYIKMGMGL
jgi:hypothetical protein